MSRCTWHRQEAGQLLGSWYHQTHKVKIYIILSPFAQSSTQRRGVSGKYTWVMWDPMPPAVPRVTSVDAIYTMRLPRASGA